MTTLSHSNFGHTEWPFPFDQSDWEKTPLTPPSKIALREVFALGRP
jgi:hypothetical protein